MDEGPQSLELSSDSTQDESSSLSLLGQHQQQEGWVERDETGESASDFRVIPRDVLFWMFRAWDPTLARTVRLVCRRWDTVGREAMDVFRTKQAFLYGVLLDHHHLRRLLDDPRFPPSLLDEVTTVAVVLGAVKDGRVLRDVAARSVRDQSCWLTCFQRVVQRTNVQAVDCLLNHEQSQHVTDKVDMIVQMVCRQQHAGIMRLVLKRYATELGPLLSSPDVAMWCHMSGYAVALAGLLFAPAFCTPHNLGMALDHGLVNHVEPLVRAVWKVGILKARRSGKVTFFKACAHGWVDVAELLLTQGLDPSTATSHEALRLAAYYGHQKVVELLCRDERPLFGRRFNVAVLGAITQRHYDLAAYLCADGRVRPDLDQNNPELNLLIVALRSEAPDRAGESSLVVRTLLDRGADPNRFGHMALRTALTRHNYAALCLLVACPRIEMLQSEFYEVLAALPAQGPYRETLGKLIRAPRFREYM